MAVMVVVSSAVVIIGRGPFNGNFMHSRRASYDCYHKPASPGHLTARLG